ncbi:hypothetical protein JD844_017104 [Phrynosoma platyrhinos]|uniref:Cadherin domain-containing protein n=1 Tax=Phrynosoma platyrhinos TaxID=52577 RepID=A0ABQ7SLC8_PHRPL|nr:hypothetical protein JD844_017104 [Phrynosoma platyrhinos]
MQKGSFVGNIAKDLGIDGNHLSDRELRILTRTGMIQYFALNYNNGHLQTSERIDREEICGRAEKCILNFQVIVESKRKLYGVEVEVADINDNAPHFPPGEQEVKINEIAIQGSRFPLPEAQDPDLGTNSIQSYQLTHSSHFSLDVRISENGGTHAELVLEKNLDREEQSVYDLILTAFDGGDPVRSGTTQIKIIVLDVNDNAPVFSQTVYKINLEENIPKGSRVCTIRATDLDEGNNGEVKYSFTKTAKKVSQMFLLNSTTGIITLIGNLDFETSSFYEFEVQAEDYAGLFDRAKVEIMVTDLNDNAPELTVTFLTNAIHENTSTGTVIAIINVEDQDSGINGEVTCSVPRNLPFQLKKTIDNFYSLVAVSALDRELVADYNITITVTDHGTPPLSTATVIPLHILDTNDNPPRFTESAYTTFFMENNQRGASIFSLRANDPDWEENARLTYSITDENVHYSVPEEAEKDFFVGHLAKDLGLEVRDLPKCKLEISSEKQYFVLNEQNGNLYVKDRIDREEICQKSSICVLKLEIVAHNPLNIFHVKVFIQDINDNAPHFPEEDIHLKVSESNLPGARFILGTAEDDDIGVNSLQNYHLSSTPYFKLDVQETKDGGKYAELILQKQLDREEEQTYHMVLTAIDGGENKKTGTAKILVTVTDINDNAPVFSQATYKGSLKENTPIGMSVLQVKASDSDEGSNAVITYTISKIQDSIQKIFNVDSRDGTIILMENIDFEDKKNYEMIMQASDGGGLVAHCKVEIEVLDENDNAPNVILTSISNPIPEDLVPGAVIALIKVHDRDSGDNGEVTCHLQELVPFQIVSSSDDYFKLLTDEPSLFTIGSHTGEIHTARVLLGRDAVKQRLVVMVKDNGHPPLSATVTVNLVFAENFQKALPEMNSQPSDSTSPSDLQFYLVLALALVSFLFLVTVILTIMMKFQRSRNPTFLQCLVPDPHSKTGAIFPPNYEDGTLPYSYQVCLSSESRRNEFAFLQPSIQIAQNILRNGKSDISLMFSEGSHLNSEMKTGDMKMHEGNNYTKRD